MDQIKIGKFIADCRKRKNLTQMQLAEQLNITDRAVSKWETGRAMPDSAIMLELCDILGISVNELLCGEVIEVKDYNKELEKNLLEMVKQKEKTDKHLLRIEIVAGVASVVVLLAMCVVASIPSIAMEEWLRLVLIGIGALPLLIMLPFLLKIEQVAGYYECAHCGHRHVPTYASVFWAMHAGRTRYMKCPNCGKRSWQKKVLSKEPAENEK